MLQTPAPEAQPMLEAHNLTKRYEDGVLALDHVNFSILPGQLFAMHLAHSRGYDPDRPRALLKVTETL